MFATWNRLKFALGNFHLYFVGPFTSNLLLVFIHGVWWFFSVTCNHLFPIIWGLGLPKRNSSKLKLKLVLGSRLNGRMEIAGESLSVLTLYKHMWKAYTCGKIFKKSTWIHCATLPLKRQASRKYDPVFFHYPLNDISHKKN